MPGRNTKKQRILDCFYTHGWGKVGREEIGVIESELRRALGPTIRTSFSYIANVLREAGAHVDYEDRYVDPWMEERYAGRLKGVLQFGDLTTAEASLRQLDAIYREYVQAEDQLGVRLVRSLVVKGKQRANKTHHEVGAKVRQTIEELGGTMPEELPTPGKSIPQLERAKKQIERK